MSTTVHRTKVVPVGYADVSQFFILTGDPDPFAITYGINVDEPPFTSGNALALRTLYVDQFNQLNPPSMAIGPIRVVVAQEGTDPLIFEAGPNTPGTDTESPRLPQNNAVLVDKRSAVGGRRNQGRLYIPGPLNEAAVDNLGVISSTLLPLLQAAADSWLSGIQAGGVSNTSDMVLFHSYEWTGDVDPGPPPGFPQPTPVVELAVDSTIATQRRRLRR